MLQSWEISVLVYHYLQKCGFNDTQSSLNKECPSLQIPEPPPKMFTCVSKLFSYELCDITTHLLCPLKI